MFARAALSFHPARPRTPSRLPSTSFLSPTYKHFARNFIVSPTYAKTGGCHPPKNVGAPTFPRFSFPSTLSVLILFKRLRTLSFSVSPLSPVPPTSSPLFTKKTRVYLLRSNQFFQSTSPILLYFPGRAPLFHQSPATNHQSRSPRLPAVALAKVGEGGPICRLRRCSPLRDTGTSASVARESATRHRQ